MIAVSNTTPLRYLIAIESEHVLGQLFETVFVPMAFHEELTDLRTPQIVRQRVMSLPHWYKVHAIAETQGVDFPAELHRGEREAILLAEHLRPDLILIDEQIGRAIALGRNLPVSGTLGILEQADKLGFISEFAKTLKQLKACGFYISDSLEQKLLQRHRIRKDSN
jgi:predicted nucleic acid-binding protein